ncbi:glyoxalase [Sphaerisporangium krabiense]|uniref:Catechol 2,3-dioxygenase-like lactoylglutathione lyase family enzyme n=1 Tax=Sphaerisporangium krabiense TaxID=763782 RepID=A0A7W9DNR1_9ACTN|nr:VOC family protein [Sphaerisporangium krabiense]MBB5625269.1 catechol 2,3-dioxygenase-like lactoylglutathione lyase family enzyme [Sphaerisporangium krabiense]GII64215.1 glyoxalase [Sphaerisporangium krabiense]
MTALRGYHHVKLPVSDLRASIDWYGRALRLEVAIEFEEDGVLRGVALRDPGATLMLALREDPGRAGALSGFDPVALGVPTLADLRDWSDHLDAAGLAHGEIAEGSAGWLITGLTDPDGIEVRLYTLEGRS